jgi:hypothetical protein
MLGRWFSGREGSSRTLRFRWTPPAPGSYNLCFEIDSADRLVLRQRVTRNIAVAGAEAAGPTIQAGSSAAEAAASAIAALGLSIEK